MMSRRGRGLTEHWEVHVETRRWVAWSTHGVLAAEVEQVVELVELPRYHEEEEPDQEDDRQAGLRVRRAYVTVADRAVQQKEKQGCGRMAT